MFAYRTGSDPIEIVDLGSKVKVTVTLNTFFFMLTYLHVSELSYVQSKWNVLKICSGRFVFEHQDRIGDDVIVTASKFSPNSCPYHKFYSTHKLHSRYQYTTT